MSKACRRIVTGYTSNGYSCIESDDLTSPPAPNVMTIDGEPDFAFLEIWRTGAAASIADKDTAFGSPLNFSPPDGGLALRIMSLPSERSRNHARHGDHFARMGVEQESKHSQQSAPQPTMHQTATIDYVIVISGRMELITERERTMVSVGDVVIQRGTKHAWSNPDDEPCVFAIVMIDAKS